MASHSQFVAECLCGYSLATPDRNSTCPKCHRLIKFEWGNETLIPIDYPQAVAGTSVISALQVAITQFFGGHENHFIAATIRTHLESKSRVLSATQIQIGKQTIANAIFRDIEDYKPLEDNFFNYRSCIFISRSATNRMKRLCPEG